MRARRNILTPLTRKEKYFDPLLELFYFNCKLFYFRNKYLKRLSLGAKERRIGANSCQKYEDLIQKYLVQRI